MVVGEGGSGARGSPSSVLRGQEAIGWFAAEVTRGELPSVGEQEEILCGAGQRRFGTEGPVEVVGAEFDAVEVGSEEPEGPGVHCGHWRSPSPGYAAG